MCQCLQNEAREKDSSLWSVQRKYSVDLDWPIAKVAVFLLVICEHAVPPAYTRTVQLRRRSTPMATIAISAPTFAVSLWVVTAVA